MSDGDIGGSSVGWLGFSQDMSQILTKSIFSPDPGDVADEEEPDLYEVEVGTGASTWLPMVNPALPFIGYVGVRPTSCIVIFDFGPESTGNIYVVGKNTPELVSILPNGEFPPAARCIRNFLLP